MLKNYLNIAIRSLKRQKVHSFINIVGLSLGLSACIIISLYVRYELSFEQMHENRDRIFRVTTSLETPERNTNIAVTPARVPLISRTDYPQVETVTQVFDFSQGRRYLTRVDDNSFYETDLFFADQHFFEIFQYAFVAGDPKTALDGPNKVVLTEEMARKYFGDKDAYGQSMQVNNGTYEVTGVIKDIPENTMIRFDFLYSLATIGQQARDTGWFPMNYLTYVQTKENADAEVYINALNKRLQDEFGEQLKAQGISMEYTLQPFTEMHYTTTIENDYSNVVNPSVIYAFVMIAAFILLIACINYINLSTAKSEKRAREVGLRKVLGAQRKQLISQFYGETLLITTISVILAVVVTELLLPVFNNISASNLDVNYFDDPEVLLSLVVVTLLVSLIAGGYPAIFMSRFMPVSVLKGAFQGSRGGNAFRRVLVVIQFAVSVFLIIGTLTIYYQMEYVRDRDLGYSSEEVLVMTLSDGSIRSQYDGLKEAFLTVPGVNYISSSNQQMTNIVAGWTAYADGMAPGATVSYRGMPVNEDFVETMGLELVAGNGFSDITEVNDQFYYLLNRSGLDAIGFTEEDAVGRMFALFEGMEGKVVGVVDDFHYSSLHKEIEPIALFLSPQRSVRFMYLQVDMNRFQSVLPELEEQWSSRLPDRPFEFSFLNNEVQAMYEKEERTANVLIAFTCFSVFIGCLGLFGLASFMAEKRTKEIGIRKVLGADVSRIVALLSKEYVRIILIANLIAWPVGYFIMNNWLESFSYRIEVGWYIFALSASISVLVALFTVSYQSIKAAISNPIKALRYE